MMGKIMKWFVVIGIIVFILIGVITVTADLNVLGFGDLGKAVKKRLEDPDETVIVKVNDLVITQNDFDLAKLMKLKYVEQGRKYIEEDESISVELKEEILSSYEESTHDDVILDSLIKNKIILSEAAKQGITVSDEEVLEAIDKNTEFANRIIEESDDPAVVESSLELKAAQESYMEGLGVGYEEYKEKYLLPGSRNKIIISLFAAEYKKDHSDEEYEAYVKELIDSAVIIYLD